MTWMTSTLTLFIAAVAGAADSALVVLEPLESDPIAVRVQGERIKQTGRIRYEGSFENEAGKLIARWDLYCDANPTGGAGIEGFIALHGPFDGAVRFELPINPLIIGPAILRSEVAFIASSEIAGTVFALDGEDHLFSVLIDGKQEQGHGPGPMQIERQTPGAITPRHWGAINAQQKNAAQLSGINDRIGIRVAGILEPNATARMTARLEVRGNRTHFKFRPPPKASDASFIPRPKGAISIRIQNQPAKAKPLVRRTN